MRIFCCLKIRPSIQLVTQKEALMLNINTNFNKCKIPIITVMASCSTLALFSYLTYIPNPTFATDGIINPANTTARSDTTTDQRTLMNIKYMQQMSDQICTNTKENKTKQLIDIRDGKSYWVTKLKDGNCWMTQNLDYDITTTDIATIQKRVYEDNKCVGWVNDNSVPQYCDPGNIGSGHSARGNYYSWRAAMGNDEGTSNATAAIQGICPKGWHLPTSNSTAKGSFGGLINTYSITNTATGSTTIQRDPLYFNRSGTPVSTGITNSGIGFYWSSTPGSNPVNAYNLKISASTVLPADSGHRCYHGSSVRCLALTTTTNLSGNGNNSEELFPDPNYPDDPDFPPVVLPDSATSNVAITVSPVISIDATSGMSSEVDFTTVAHGDITATISSNQKYQVLLSTNQSTLEQSPIVPNHNIPMITTDTTITPGTRAWGIKKTNSALAGGTLGDTTANTLFSPIGIGNNKVLFYESLGAESKTITFPVAISVDSTLPSGTYATEVTITATAN